MMNTERFVFLDLETTGLDPERDVITEMAWIFERAGRVVEQHYHVRYDGFPSIWSARNTAVGKRRDLQEVVPPVHAFGEFFEDCLLLSQDGARVYLVGASPSFDHSFLRKQFREVPYHFHLIDIEAVAMGALGLNAPPKLKELRAALGVAGENEHTHNALFDAREVKFIWDTLKARHVV